MKRFLARLDLWAVLLALLFAMLLLIITMDVWAPHVVDHH